MTQQHPIAPPPELVRQWQDESPGKLIADHIQYLATRAAQWGADQQLKLDAEQIEKAYQAGADQELEACCERVDDAGYPALAANLRAARRPKPPSLKEQALIHFESFAATFETSGGDSDLIRRALEQLPDYTSEEP